MNKNYQMIIEPQDIISGWLSGKNLDSIVVNEIDEINIYNNWCAKYDMPTINAETPDLSDNIVEKNTDIDNWNMPQEYKELNIEEHIISMCKSQVELDRVNLELAEFKKRRMYPVLKFLVYLVNICEENDVVLGVGRGSSVASYILYLINVHHIDSIKYNLDIKEFLK